MKKALIALAVGIAAGAAAGYGIGDARHNGEKGQARAEAIAEINEEISSQIFLSEADIYSSEGFQFSPGGGYYFYPRGMEVLTESQREEIQKKLECKLSGMNYLSERIDDALKEYKQ